MKRKLIFFDIDGTILDANNYIPPSAAEAIHMAQEAGHICVINTGRPYTHIQPSVRAMGFDGYICSCGQHIVLNGKCVLHDGFNHADSVRFEQIARECGMDVICEAETGVWHTNLTNRAEMIKSAAHFAELGFDVNGRKQDAAFAFDKFCVYTNLQCDLERFTAAVAPYFTLIDREGDLIEMPKKGYSKETGIRYVETYLDIAHENTWSIGDSTNDLPMFYGTAHSIAMGNAPKEVQEAAEFTTLPLMEDGLAAALKKYII